MIGHPVAGKRVLVTRAARDATRWATRLAALGAMPVVLPCLVSEPIADAGTRAAFRAAVTGGSWLLLTSPRGCAAAAHLLGGTELPPELQVAAVGPATAAAATQQLGRVDLVARTTTSQGLARELVQRLRRDATIDSATIVIAGAANGRDDAATILRGAGARIVRVAIYRTIPVPATATRRDLAAEGIEVVILASPSAVAGLLGCASVAGSMQVITIGPTTSAAAVAAGLTITAEARRPTLDGILEVIV